MRPVLHTFNHGKMCLGVLLAGLNSRLILRRIVAGESGLVVLELDYGHAIRCWTFHYLARSGTNDKGRPVLVKSCLVQGNVFFVSFLVCNIDHCNPVSLLAHCLPPSRTSRGLARMI